MYKISLHIASIVLSAVTTCIMHKEVITPGVCGWIINPRHLWKESECTHTALSRSFTSAALCILG